MTKEEPAGLGLLRKPFAANQISKLPKPTKQQTDAVKNDFKLGIRCKLCGAWHHPDVVHLDYVGHAALTDRLLECDINWNWEPVAVDDCGAPMIDSNGGMWIRLTVCGVTRLGYGHPDGKRGGDAVKEVIGDALRNAAMRFGAALDLWHKGELHVADNFDATPKSQSNDVPSATDDETERAKSIIATAPDMDALKAAFLNMPKWLQAKVADAKDARKAELEKITAEANTKLPDGDDVPEFLKG